MSLRDVLVLAQGTSEEGTERGMVGAREREKGGSERRKEGATKRGRGAWEEGR